MIKPEYLKLVQLLQRYDYEYHTLSRSSVSDAVYDNLLAQIKAFEAQNPQQIAQFSPTQRVGSSPSHHFRKVRHQPAMLSLNDAFSSAELKQWLSRLEKLLRQSQKTWQYFVDIKMDGLALAVIYEDGLFVQAVTRGDGQLGEDVAANAKTMRNLPLSLPQNFQTKTFTKGRFEVRGEVILYDQDFVNINRQNQAQGQALYANARNLAAGTMRQLDPQLVAKRCLIFKAYDIVSHHFATFDALYKTFSLLNFSHNRQAKVCRNVADLQRTLQTFMAQRSSLPFGSDGVVIKLNDFTLYEACGSVAKAPRGALAYKYPPQQATTVLQDIILQIGRTGVVTPVALLQPVKLAGTTVTHASLHNADEIGRLDARQGDTVVVFKAGDIIPKVEKVILELRQPQSVKFDFEAELGRQHPTLKFKRLAHKVAYKVRPSPQNTNQLLPLAITHYASRGAVNIMGLGQANSQALVVAGLVQDLADIYALTVDQLLPLERFGPKASHNLISAIAQAKNPPLDKFIFGLGIAQVGLQTAQDLARHFKTWARFRRANFTDFIALPGLGDKTATTLEAWLNDISQQSLMKKLIKLGVKPQAWQTGLGRLAGKKLVITGTLKQYSRAQATQLITSAGGQLQNQVTQSTDYVIVGQNPGQTKLTQAKTFKITILNPAQFQKLLD